MAIRPKKQTPSNKGETGGGVRVVGTGGGQSSGMRISPNVKVVPGTISKNVTSGSRTTRGGVTGGKMLKGAEQARAENVRALGAKSSKKALKSANKPTNKVGSKADKALRKRTNSVVMSKEQAVKSYDAMYGKGTGKDITQINKQVTPKNEARSVRKMPKKK